MLNVSFQSDNLTLHGTLDMPDSADKPVPGVIIFHGMTNSEAGYVSLVAMLAEHGIAGLAVTMRGHGESQGDFHKSTVAEALADAIAAYDFLVSQPDVDAGRIGMVGSSVGAILAALATGQRSIQSLLFRAPAAYTTAMMQLSMAGTMDNEASQFHEVNNLESTPAGRAIEAFAGSFVVVASENDVIIPPAVTEGYVSIAKQANKKQLTIIKDATHTLTELHWKDAFNQIAIDWFSDTLLKL